MKCWTVSQEPMDTKYYSLTVDATPDASHDEQHALRLHHL